MQLTFFSYLNPGKRDSNTSSRSVAGDGNLPEGVMSLTGIACVLNKPRSVGTVRIVLTDPNELPSVDPKNLNQLIDRKISRELLQLGWSIITKEPLKSLLGTPFVFTDEIMADDIILDEAIASNNPSAYHFAGTFKMAPSEREGTFGDWKAWWSATQASFLLSQLRIVCCRQL
jgi:choline dehydrogenase